jgi:hypothetical protein
MTVRAIVAGVPGTTTMTMRKTLARLMERGAVRRAGGLDVASFEFTEKSSVR